MINRFDFYINAAKAAIMLLIATLLFSLGFTQSAFAATFTSVMNGNWTDTNTWEERHLR